MPFSNEEQQIIIYGKQQGKNRDEILRALNNYKLGIKTNPVEVEKPSYLERIGQAAQAGVAEVGSGVTGLMNAPEVKSVAGTQKELGTGAAIADTAAQALQAGVGGVANLGKILGGAFQTALSPVTPALQSVGETIGKPLGQAVPLSVADTIESAANTPIITDNIKTSLEIANLAFPEVATRGATMLGTARESATGYVGNKVGQIGEAVESAIPKVPGVNTSNISAALMDRIGRISPTRRSKFQQMTGNSVGEYLTKYGITGSSDQVVAQLYQQFKNSLDAVNNALASAQPKRFKTPAVADALTELKAKMESTGTQGAPNPLAEKINQIDTVYNTQGLTLAQENAVKRLYEGNVKLDYVKTINPEGVARATNIDSAIRSNIFKNAEKLGVTGLAEQNKITQAAKFLMDEIGAASQGRAANNMIGLTDWILASQIPATPAALAAFLGKKALSSDTVLGYMAKLFAPTPEKSVMIQNSKPYNAFNEIGSSAKTTQSPQIARKEINRTPYTESKASAGIESKGANSTTNLAKDLGVSEDLIKEARKYKSAEEFVKAQGTPVYHGTNKNFDTFDVSKKGSTQGFDEPGIFFTSDKNIAKTYNADYVPKPKYKLTPEEALKNDNLQIKEAFVKESDFKDLIQQLDEAYVWGEIKTKPDFDGVRPSTFFDMNRESIKELLEARPETKGLKVTAEGQTVYMVTDTNLIKTKSQLTDIWNKANK